MDRESPFVRAVPLRGIQSPETEASGIDQAVDSFTDYCAAQKELRDFESEDSPQASARKMELLRATTTYYARLMETVLANRETPQLLARMWKEIAGVAKEQNETYLARSTRRGVLSQVATYRVFQQLGHTPTFATPDEDAFNAVDMWEDDQTALQVEWSDESKPQLLNTESLPIPTVALSGIDADRYYSSRTFSKATRFRRKLQSLKRGGKKVHGYLLVVPDSMMDKVTGEPTQEIIHFVQERLGLTKQEKLAA